MQLIINATKKPHDNPKVIPVKEGLDTLDFLLTLPEDRESSEAELRVRATAIGMIVLKTLFIYQEVGGIPIEGILIDTTEEFHPYLVSELQDIAPIKQLSDL